MLLMNDLFSKGEETMWVGNERFSSIYDVFLVQRSRVRDL